MSTPTAGAIKMFAFIERRPDFSESDFHDYWRHPHGTMAKQKIKSMQRYIQAHKFDKVGGVPAAPHDGVAEMWYADMDTANRLNDDPEYSLHAGADEKNFMEIGPNTFRVLSSEMQVIPLPSGESNRGVKFLHLVRAAEGARNNVVDSLASEQTVKLAKGLGVVGYTLCETLPETYVNELPPPSEPHHWLTLDPYDVVREIWFSDEDSYRAATNAAEWPDFLTVQGLDVERSPGFLAREEVVIW